MEGVARLLCLAQQNARAITQLARSEHTLNALVDNAPAAVSLLDTEGRFLLVNRETERVMGVPRSEILGRSREEVAGFSANGDLFRENDLAVAAARRPLTFEETVRLADGDHTYVSVKFPLIDEVGSVFGVGGMSTDITPLKLLQAEADRAWQEAIRRIAIAVEYRDEETGNHIDRMAAYCELIASHLDLGATYAATIRRAAPLHDAGKIAIPDNILLKVGELDIFERASWKLTPKSAITCSRVRAATSSTSPPLSRGRTTSDSTEPAIPTASWAMQSHSKAASPPSPMCSTP